MYYTSILSGNVCDCREISGGVQEAVLKGVVLYLQKGDNRKHVIQSGNIPMQFKGLEFDSLVNGLTYTMEDSDMRQLAALWDSCLANSQLRNKEKLAELTKISEMLWKRAEDIV